MRWAVLLALAATASADGKFVSKEVPVVGIPDQQAILVWKEGRERLVIDTAFSGEGDLAWIVPLPAAPKIEPVSPAVFRTIEVVTMPALRQRPDDMWKAGLYLLIAIAVLSAVPGRYKVVRLLAIPVLLLGFIFPFVLLIPKAAVAGGGVALLERGIAGSYETATVQAVDVAALLSWLQENGFKVAPEVRSGIEAYVRDGWVFAVARLKQGGSGGRAHPLSFEFDAKEPVYPMRLTGTQDRPVSLRLFVLSDRRARCDGLSVESCYETRPAEPRWGFYPDEDELRTIGQRELLAIAGGATVLTTLRGDLAPAQMRADLHPTFEAYEPLVPVLYSEDAARSGAASTATWIALALLLPCSLVALLVQRRKKDTREIRRSPTSIGRRAAIVVWCVAIDLGLIAGVVDYVTTDVTKTRDVGHGGAMAFLTEHRRAGAIVAASSDIETARAAAAAFWNGERNPYDGDDVREEASPGNYGLELRDGKVVYVPYNTTGMPMW